MSKTATKDERVEVRITCYSSELQSLSKRLKLSNLSNMSRYLLECGLNVRGVQDWQERAFRVQLISNVTVLSNELLEFLATNKCLERDEKLERLRSKVEDLNEMVRRLFYLYETNLFDKEDESRLQKKSTNGWNYFQSIDCITKKNLGGI